MLYSIQAYRIISNFNLETLSVGLSGLVEKLVSAALSKETEPRGNALDGGACNMPHSVQLVVITK